MLMRFIRVFSALLYSMAFAVSLTRCSPNAASVDKALLKASAQGNRGTGINVDANIVFRETPLKTSFMDSREFRKQSSADASRGEFRFRISSNDEDSREFLEAFRRTGSFEFAYENHDKLSPSSVIFLLPASLIDQGISVENCSFEIHPTAQGSWKVSLRESESCSTRRALLDGAEDLIVVFRSKDITHWVDSTDGRP